jgi:hypothetical protein
VRRHPDLVLNLLAQRIGKLAPDPGGLAVWTIPEFATLHAVADELSQLDVPIELDSAATYSDFGREIL